MRDLKLLDPGESVFDLSFRDFYTRVEKLLQPGLKQARGISRWAAPLRERQLYIAARRAGAGALSLAVLSWVVATIRVGDAVRENIVEFGNLSYQGRRRLGMQEEPPRNRTLAPG